jgi:hypothetical protein
MLRPNLLVEVLKSKVTGARPSFGDVQEITGAEMMD